MQVRFLSGLHVKKPLNHLKFEGFFVGPNGMIEPLLQADAAISQWIIYLCVVVVRLDESLIR
jgi:hypothetical protein